MENNQVLNKKHLGAIVLFYCIAIACRYLANKITFLEDIDSAFLKIVLTGAGPALGALIVIKAFAIKPNLSLKGSCNSILVSFLIFVLFPIIGFTIIGLNEGDGFIIKSNEHFAAAKLSFYIIIYAFLEELGWRGFLHDNLPISNSYLKYILIGILWFVWHLNFTLSTSNFVFLLILIFASWGIGKIKNITNSLLAVTGFHALYNLYSITNVSTQGKLVVLSLCAFIWVGFIIFSMRRNKLISA